MMRALITIALLAMASPAFAIDWNNREDVVRAAVERQPSLAAAAANVEAARARIAPAGSLPNPMLMAGVQDQQTDLTLDEMMTMYMVGASQTLVRKSRRDALRRAAQLDVQRLERELESRRAEIEREVRSAWTDAAAAQAQIAAIADVARLTRTIVDAARIRYETGSAPQADMIRARLEQSNIEHSVLARGRERDAARARLRPLLGMTATDEMPLFALEMMMMERPERAPFDSTVTDTPAIAALQADVARAEAELRLAQLARRPDLTVEASYGARPLQKDMFSVTGRIELPLRRSTLIAPRIREAEARRLAAQLEIEALRQQIRQDVGEAVASRTEAVEQIELHVESLVPQSKMAFDSALAAYQNGRTTFEAVLGSLQAYRTLSVDYYDYVRQRLRAEIDIEAIRRGATGAGSAMGGATARRPMNSPSTSSSSMGMR